jgi:flavin-dependent dehydrogenase
MNPADVADVAIVGGGPAGAALARRLAGAGRSVVLFEASRFDAPRVGETLSPQVQSELGLLGVRDRCHALHPLPSWGVRSHWGDAGVQLHSHLASPWGCGWHVDRAAFDRVLAASAREAGAHLVEGSRVRDVQHDGRAWCVDAADRRWHARWIVDATGRPARIARRLGARRLLFDALVGVAATCRDPDPAGRHHLLLEAVAEGWWYSAPLPGGADASAVVMLMTDADACAGARLHRTDAWHAALARSSATQARCAQALTAPQVHPAQSHRLVRGRMPAPGPWLAVGDAALAVDPLSGSGVLRALQQAREAADTIVRGLEDPPCAGEAIAAFEAACDDACTRYLVERAGQYAMERRYATPFWQRRLRAAGVSAPVHPAAPALPPTPRAENRPVLHPIA